MFGGFNKTVNQYLFGKPKSKPLTNLRMLILIYAGEEALNDVALAAEIGVNRYGLKDWLVTGRFMSSKDHIQLQRWLYKQADLED